MTSGADVSMQEAKFFEKEGFVPILQTAKELNLQIQTQYKVSNNISREIVKFVNEERFNLMLVGSSRSMFSSNEIGGRAKYFFDDAKCSVGVLVDRGFQKINHILIILDKTSDSFLFNLMNHFLLKTERLVSIWDQQKLLQKNETFNYLMNENNKTQIKRIEMNSNDNISFENYDLIIVSLEYWNKLKKENTEWLSYSPSILIVNK